LGVGFTENRHVLRRTTPPYIGEPGEENAFGGKYLMTKQLRKSVTIQISTSNNKGGRVMSNYLSKTAQVIGDQKDIFSGGGFWQQETAFGLL
jgi:hypothetical protein